jgi:hypothetical protein
MKYFTVFTLFLLIFIPNLCFSETGNKEFPDTLYTLDKIMNLSGQLQLTGEQKKKIESLSIQYNNDSIYLNGKLENLSKRFAGIIDNNNINRIEASLVLDEINSVEKIYKEKTILFLIDLKNLLTEDQQKILSDHTN